MVRITNKMQLGRSTHQISYKEATIISPIELTIDVDHPDCKVLFIGSVESFDRFTNKYGYIDFDNGLGIKWNDVSSDFIGFGLGDIIEDRFLTAPFNGVDHTSWWDIEYSIDSFILFENDAKGSDSDSGSDTGSDSNSDSESDKEEQQESTSPVARVARFFKLINPETGESTGRFTGYTPRQAASKAFTKMLQYKKLSGDDALGSETNVQIVESTRGAPHKVSTYACQRKKLDEPQRLFIKTDNGVERVISYSYRNEIRRVHAEENESS